MLPLEQATGQMIAVTPTIANELKMLLPTTLPMARSACPLTAEITLTTNSGADVPKATIVKPMTKLETLNRRAISEAPSVSQSAPLMMSNRPTMNFAISSIMLIEEEDANKRADIHPH